ncbi:platelet glycoprotein Ib alpha chain [Cuculus canorus]|uniref:platelet glycoprotein Ib alpha chain n=1 Tax=Cuculus canorus TaxID=55661 RepID=UPI0023AA7AA5|nr:platelet glycoprotein Ib alpha chain [Cuculus canorus]XP_053906135.1 platelet glycoprotein Ib alpha chain [Cuculus canorus]XP_053906136.1 platelet glycoprotein Ib alpha chain [Cuculus canorus]
MWIPVLLPLFVLAPLPPASSADPCPSEMNKVKDILEVNCTGQALSAVPQGLPTNTGILLLNANRLVSLSTAAFLPLDQLQDLDLSDNELAALDTETPLPSLREVILSRNALVALPDLRGLPGLTRLALAHNSLVTLAPEAFRAVPQLQDLDLRGNQLQTLPQDAFAGLKALKDLDLSDNLLEELPKELLQDLHDLETLWLSGNRLRTLPTNFFPEGHFFAYVFLTENPWHCDCNLHYLRTWIRRHSDVVYQPERGLEKTKVEIAPEKVLCHSPRVHWRKPVIHFEDNCGSTGDADEEEDYGYGDGEEKVEKATMTNLLPPHPSTHEEHATVTHAVDRPLLATMRPSLSTPYSSTFIPSTALATPASSRAPSATSPAPAGPIVTPSAATTRSVGPTSTPHRFTTLIFTTSLPATASTRPPNTSSHGQTTLANSYVPPMVSTDTFSTTSVTVPPTAMPKTSSIVRSSSLPLMPTTPMVSITPAPTSAAALTTTRITQPEPSPPAPRPLCPCSTPGLAAPVLRLRAGGEGPQWGQWVLRHCCLLHWLLYLASLALLVLTMLVLAGCLAWVCLVGWPSWRKSLQTQAVEYPLLEWRESTGSSAMHFSSFESHLRRPMFCTIKEVVLCPEVTYCTIKDLGVQRSPPASSSFCATKELWIHHGPQNTLSKPFSREVVVPELSSLRTPSVYSLDRGVEAIGDVRVKYAGNTL